MGIERNMKYKNLVIFVLLLICFPAQAEFTQDMETDRPDFTEGTQTVQEGHAQFEMGYTYTRDKEGGETSESHGYPEFLIRAGLAEALELRVFWEGWAHSELDDGAGTVLTDDGAADMSIGFKARLAEEDGNIPALSIIGEIGLPLGNKEFSSEDPVPATKLLWAYGLSDDLAIAGNFNFGFPVESDDYYFEVGSSLALGYSLSDSIGTFIEYFGMMPADSTDAVDDTHFVDTGFTYLINQNLQLDVRAGFGINDAADDFFAGTGLSFRL